MGEPLDTGSAANQPESNPVPAPDTCPDNPGESDLDLCSRATLDTDSDGDGVADCDEECAHDPRKTEPRPCGCGVAETKNGQHPLCKRLGQTLVHRYPFSGSGTAIATETAGNADGVIVNTETLSGAVALAGESSGQSVEFPSGALDGVVDLTVESWVTWKGGGPWQRIFDFGSVSLNLKIEPELNTMFHVAVVFDDANDEIHMYLDGQRQGSVSTTNSLAEMQLKNL